MKKLLAALLICGLVICCGAFALSENLAEGADSDWYMDVLNDEATMRANPYYHFEDINGDGVPLLFISTTPNAFITAEDHGAVYAYDHGGAKLLKEVGGQGGEKFFRNGEEHTLTYYYRFSGEQHLEVYRLEDGALVPVTTADAYGPFHYPEYDNKESVYLHDGEEITEQESEALFEKYAGDGDAISFEEVSGYRQPITVAPSEAWFDADEGTYAAAFDRNDLSEGVLSRVHLFTGDSYSALDIVKLAVGDTFVAEGQPVEIRSLEKDEAGNLSINGGMDAENGYTLTPEDEGNDWRILLDDDYRTYTDQGEVALTLDENVTFTDGWDITKEPVVTAGLENVARAIAESENDSFDRYNTEVTIEDGRVIEIHRYFVP